MRNKRYLMVLIFLVSSVLSYKGVNAMGLSDVGKVCLFSKMEGVIKLDGKPVLNAKLVRTVNLSKDEVDETITDKNGNFKFEAIVKRKASKLLPQEFSVSQLIYVHYKDKEYRMWSGVKRKPEENSESRGKPLVVTCELSSEEDMVIINNSPIFSLCTWDVEQDEQERIF